MKFYIISGDPAIKKKGWLFMRKQKNEPLAMEVLKEQIRHTRFWRTAFIAAIAVVAVNCIPGGGKHE